MTKLLRDPVFWLYLTVIACMLTLHFVLHGPYSPWPWVNAAIFTTSLAFIVRNAAPRPIHRRESRKPHLSHTS